MTTSKIKQEIFENAKEGVVIDSSEDKYWRDLRNQAAIAALQGYLAGVKQWDYKEEIAITCVTYANALINELKEKV